MVDALPCKQVVGVRFFCTAPKQQMGGKVSHQAHNLTEASSILVSATTISLSAKYAPIQQLMYQDVQTEYSQLIIDRLLYSNSNQATVLLTYLKQAKWIRHDDDAVGESKTNMI